MRHKTITLYMFTIFALIVSLPAFISPSNAPKATESELILTVHTDKPLYIQSEVVNIFGTVQNSTGDPITNATIGVEVRNSYNNTIFLDILFSSSNGTYEDNFRLHPDAPTGEYHVYVTATALGYPVTMKQTTFTVEASVGINDIAVTNVNPLKTVVGQGYSLFINVTVENQGDFIESFNVSVFYDDTVITLPDGKNHTTTTLTSGNSTTLTLTWNTTGVAMGNHTITAKATQLPGETDLDDNTRTDGWVVVTWLGDLDADFDVDQFDYWYFCSAFIDYYTIHVKDPFCDFDDDCDIDQFDFWAFCGAFIDYYKTK